MAARVVCGSQPEAAVSSSRVAPSGRATASSSTPSLPPGRPGRAFSPSVRQAGAEVFAASRRGASAGAVSTPIAARPAGVTIRRLRSPASATAAGPLRSLRPALARRLGDQAAAAQRLQRLRERGALELERRGCGQDAPIGAGGGGGEQQPPGCRKASAWVFVLRSGAARDARPPTDRRPEAEAVGPAGGAEAASRTSTLTLSCAPKSSELSQPSTFPTRPSTSGAKLARGPRCRLAGGGPIVTVRTCAA